MPSTETESAAALRERMRKFAPWGHRLARTGRHLFRRALGKPRTVSESPNLLPLLIRVLAAFAKGASNEIQEQEIDSSLGFLRYDYPDAVYGELRAVFRQALNEQHDLADLAARLAGQLSTDQKIMLGVQLFDLISKASFEKDLFSSYYDFMGRLGLGAQAFDIVFQLNATEEAAQLVPPVYGHGESPLETLAFGSNGNADVHLKVLGPGERLLAFRYHDLILLKNHTTRPVVVRGRPLPPGQFCRVYAGQRIVLAEQVLTHQDLVYYFNAKKNVALTTTYLSIDRSDAVQIDKARSRDSVLEITFGLKVTVRALRPVDARINGIALVPGEPVHATLEDKILFHGNAELPLSDLRRKARALGGRFTLQAHKSEYLVSNNPNLLREDDILLSPGTAGEVLLKIACNYASREGTVEVLQADRPILVGETPVRHTAPLKDGDTIRIDTGQILRVNFEERIIEEERNVISSLDVRDLVYRFPHGGIGIDNVSFTANRGELICVMGASGCGKSTLLKAICGRIIPTRGQVLLNGTDLHANLENLQHFIAYVPQDDAFDEHLTIEENLDFAAAIRAPHLGARDRARRVEGKLLELGLAERRGYLVGESTRKVLSGGERKRLNIGLDMIGGADVYLFDEPTSGLSSKDSEHIIEIIRSMAHNKIVLVTIHQPTSKIFQMFNKTLLLDKGGKLVFFGTPQETLAYFAAAEHEQHFGTELGGCPACGTTRPEFIFDVLETPLRDLSGDVIYEENAQGQLVPARRFSPDYWRDKFESYRLMNEVKQVAVKKPPLAPNPEAAPVHRRERVRWRDEITRFRTLCKRAFLSKLRNRANLLITIVEAPLLAAVIGTVLRYSEQGRYDFASAFHIPTYLFLMLIVAMFLGLTNSSDDIIRDRTVLQRERNLDLRLGYYVFAKGATLALFAAVQCALFTIIGNGILEVRGMFWTYFFFAFLTALTGVSLGLLISSVVASAKAAANIVPLVLIPQIILGGALIKYEEMNQDLDVSYLFQRWFAGHPDAEKEQASSRLVVPLICEFIPMRWSYEALVIAQARLNPLTSRQDRLQREIDSLKILKPRTPEQAARLADLKEALAILSGLECATPREIDRRLNRIDRFLRGVPLQELKLRSTTSGLGADTLYVNQKIADMVNKSETEQSDYRRMPEVDPDLPPEIQAELRRPPYINVFFGPSKRYFGVRVSTLAANTSVVVGFTLISLGLLHLSLHRQLRTRA